MAVRPLVVEAEAILLIGRQRIWPTYAVKASGLFFLTTGVLAALGGLAQINPIWVYGPFEPSEVSAASQPDWYVGWLEGALRAMPAWEVRAFGFELPNPFFAGVLLPGVTFGLLYAWPFLEARLTKDREEHHLLDRPRDRPLRIRPRGGHPRPSTPCSSWPAAAMCCRPSSASRSTR